MEVVVTTAVISRAKLQSNHQIITTNKPTSNFLQTRCPSCRPTNNVKALKRKISHFTNLLTPSSPGVFQLCLWPLTAAGYLGEVCHASHEPSLGCQYPRRTEGIGASISHFACLYTLTCNKKNINEQPAGMMMKNLPINCSNSTTMKTIATTRRDKK